MSNIISQGRAALVRAKKSLQFIKSYEDAVLQEYNDNRVEVMMLLCAEMLHDEFGFGKKRIQKALTGIDDRMLEFINPEGVFEMDKMRIRVFDKTGFMFACNEKDHQHIMEVLETAGYKVEVVNGEE